MKMTMVLVFLIDAGELAQRLAHEAGLQAGQRIAHLAFDFGLGRERGDRVDDDEVDRGRAHQRIDDLERLLAGVGLADEQLLQVDAELLRVLDVERVLGIDEGAGAAELLHLGDDLQGERGLAARFRAVDLDHPAARQAADAERDVEAERAGGDDLDVVDHLAFAQPHDRALAELLLDLRQGGLQGLGFFGVEGFDGLRPWRCSWGCGDYPQRLDVCTVPAPGNLRTPHDGREATPSKQGIQAGRRSRRRPRPHRVEHRFGLVGLGVGLVVELAAQARLVEVAGPFGDHDGRDAVADQVGQRARLRHEAVDAEDQRQPGDRHVADRRQRRRQHDEAAAGDAGRAFRGQQQHRQQA